MIGAKLYLDTHIEPRRLSIMLSSIQGYLGKVALLLLQCRDGLSSRQ